MTLKGPLGILPSTSEIMQLLYPVLERVESIGSISIDGTDRLNDRMIMKQWLHDGCYTERWEQGFRGELYHGRTGAYYKSEETQDVDFEDWTLPEILPHDNSIGLNPWNNALRMRNSKNGVDVDDLYIGFPKAHHRQIMCFEAYLPTPAAGAPDLQYIGFEVNSGGSFALLACLACHSGQWQLYAINHRNAAKTNNVTLRHSNAYARYALVYDPPILELWEPSFLSAFF